MSEIIRLLAVVIVLCVLCWIAQQIPLPEPFRWIAWVVVFFIALCALLPIIGVHV